MKDPSEWVTDSSKSINPERYDIEKHQAERVTRGFSEYDWWNFNSYLTFVILGGLKKFKEDGNGWPGGIKQEEWPIILDKMIAGFEAQEDLSEHWPAKGQSYEDWQRPLLEKWDEGSALFIEYYGTLWD